MTAPVTETATRISARDLSGFDVRLSIMLIVKQLEGIGVKPKKAIQAYDPKYLDKKESDRLTLVLLGLRIDSNILEILRAICESHNVKI